MQKSKTLKKIVVTGPESVGKTTLCMELQKRLNAVIIPEYARTYIESIGRHYTYDDVEQIARRQVAEFKKAVADNKDKDFLDSNQSMVYARLRTMPQMVAVGDR